MLCVSPLWLILSLSANTPAHTSGITIRFYRCLPTLRPIHPDSLSDLRCQPHQQDVACFPIHSILDKQLFINWFWKFSFELSINIWLVKVNSTPPLANMEITNCQAAKLSFPPTATFPQIKFDSVSILPLSTCCILRHVFICPLDQIHIFPYSLIV